ncbi:MAG: protein kinase [Acidobacteriota bacterium]
MSALSKFGRYEIREELGRGGMGIVYRAVDPALDRTVALKVIHPQHLAAEKDRAELIVRFLREAKAAARVNAPGVVTVHDTGQEGDTLYLVMEYVVGESLQRQLAQRLYRKPADALRLVAEVADALHVAHSMGVVHRDIKPSNILITRDGRVKVTDFGVAKVVSEGVDLTRTGSVLGSPAYMSPEQLRGDKVDGRADLFSLGVVLYELLLHKRPFPADTITTLIFQILNSDPLQEVELKSSLPPEVLGFLRWCLEKKCEDRVPDAANFAARARELAAWVEAAPDPVADQSEADTVFAPSRAPQTVGRPIHRKWVIATIAGVSVSLGVLVTFVINYEPKSRPETSPPAAVSPSPAITPNAPAGGLAGAMMNQSEPGEDVEASDTIIGQGTEGAPSSWQPSAVGKPPAAPSNSQAPVLLPSPAPAAPEPPPPATTPSESASRPPAPTPAKAPQAVAPPPFTPPREDDLYDTYECTRSLELWVYPMSSHLEINGKPVSMPADLEEEMDHLIYTFPGPGKYYCRVSHPGYQPLWVMVTVRPDADEESAYFDLELEQN